MGKNLISLFNCSLLFTREVILGDFVIIIWSEVFFFLAVTEFWDPHTVERAMLCVSPIELDVSSICLLSLALLSCEINRLDSRTNRYGEDKSEDTTRVGQRLFAYRYKKYNWRR